VAMICPDEAQVAMFVQGDMPVEDVSRLEAHLDGCERCLAIVAQAAEASAARSRIAETTSALELSGFAHLIAALARSDRAAPSVPPAAPDGFGPYRVLGVLGRGAMGVVYEAVHRTSGRAVAIKTVASPSPKLLAAVRQEIAFLERQRHPGIVEIFENGVIDGDPWYAMERLVGGTLEDFNRSLWGGRRDGFSVRPAALGSSPETLAAGGRLDEVLTLFVRLSEPLAFVHRAGIVHCDLKPANVFIRSSGQPVIMDFGLLSRASGAIGRESLEVGGHLRGTLPYLSPELIRGHIPDARADLYGLGCILYESVTGRPPFVASTANGFLDAHLHSEPEPASRFASGVPKELDELLAALLAKAPAQRIGDANVVAELLGRLRASPESRRPSRRPSLPYLFRPRMVGRERVLEEMAALRVEAGQGRGQFLLISGESGIGKTFLASEVARQAARAGFDVVTGECMPMAPTEQGGREIVASALEPLRKLLQHAADRYRASGQGETLRLESERTIRVLARYEPALAHILASAPDEDLAPLPPTAERERVLQALRDLLDRVVAVAPLLVVIDDLQWADDLSLAFLDSLADHAFTDKPLLLVGLYRSEEKSKALADLEAKEHVQSFRLERLDSSALAVMVGDLLSDSPPATFIQTLVDHSEGNPFFVAEYLRAAAAEGRLERTAGGWRLSAGAPGSHGYDDLTLPPSLQALLERRLALLTPGAQRATEAASVLGRECGVRMLAALVGSEETELAQAIGEMVERQVVQQTGADGLRFVHDKTREAAYARVDAERRRELHLAAANVIEATYLASLELPVHFAELAYHLQRGGDAARAVDYFEKAGEHALRFSAAADAVQLIRESLAMEATLPARVSVARRARWQRQLGEALQGIGRIKDSVAPLTQAASLLGKSVPTGNAQLGLRLLPQIALQTLHRLMPSHFLERGGADHDTLLETGRVFDGLQRAYYFSGQGPQLMFANLNGLNLLEQVAPTPELAITYATTAATAGLAAGQGLAGTYFGLALATLERAADRAAESYVRKLLGLNFTWLGMATEAAEQLDRAIALAEATGYFRQLDECIAIRASLDITAGRHVRAGFWVSRLEQSAERRDDKQMLSWAYMQRTQCALLRGDYGDALRSLAATAALLPVLEVPEELWFLALRADVALRSGDSSGAWDGSARADRILDAGTPILSQGLDTYARLTEIQLALWNSDPKSPMQRFYARGARRVCRLLSGASRMFRVGMPMALLNQGTLSWLSGRRANAVKLWARGLDHAKAMDLPYDEARLSLALASASVDETSSSARLAHRARSLLKELQIPESAITRPNTRRS